MKTILTFAKLFLMTVLFVTATEAVAQKKGSKTSGSTSTVSKSKTTTASKATTAAPKTVAASKATAATGKSSASSGKSAAATTKPAATAPKTTTAAASKTTTATAPKPIPVKSAAKTGVEKKTPSASPVLSKKADEIVAAADTVVADTVVVDTIPDTSSVRKKGNILIIGKGKYVRACNPFSYTPQRMADYAGLINEYQDSFPNVKVYYVAIPTSYEFYVPETAKKVTQRSAIDDLFSNLNNKVIKVDAYNTLLEHKDEPIYSRTDHHWAPLGAFYAAQTLAREAKVPFRGLDAYDRGVVRDYVGSMYRFTKDAALKQAPEEFYYYMPKEAALKTTYIHYTVNKNSKKVTSETEPKEGNFFRIFKDGNGSAYCTFMGGDERLTRVETPLKNGRRVLVLKDSFGNALSSFLFYSFEQVHVVDCRYFTKNLIDYVRDNGITDIVFANNIAHTSAETVANYRQYLVQGRPVVVAEPATFVEAAEPVETVKE